MIARTYIDTDLRKLEERFQRAKSNKEASYLAKLALLELTGWVEESMDEIVLRCSRRHTRDLALRTWFEKEFVEDTYSFVYKSHFRRMLVGALGIRCVAQLERGLDQAELDRLKAALGSLKKARDEHAHTHLKGVQRTVQGPSVTRQQFRDVYAGLRAIEAFIRHRQW